MNKKTKWEYAIRKFDEMPNAHDLDIMGNEGWEAFAAGTNVHSAFGFNATTTIVFFKRMKNDQLPETNNNA